MTNNHTKKKRQSPKFIKKIKIMSKKKITSSKKKKYHPIAYKIKRKKKKERERIKK